MRGSATVWACGAMSRMLRLRVHVPILRPVHQRRRSKPRPKWRRQQLASAMTASFSQFAFHHVSSEQGALPNVLPQRQLRVFFRNTQTRRARKRGRARYSQQRKLLIHCSTSACLTVPLRACVRMCGSFGLCTTHARSLSLSRLQPKQHEVRAASR